MHTKQTGSFHLVPVSCSHRLGMLSSVAQHIPVPSEWGLRCQPAGFSDSTGNGEASQPTAIFPGDGRNGWWDAEGVPWGLALLSLDVPGGLVKPTRKKLTPDCPWCLSLLVWRTLGCDTLGVLLILFIILILTYTLSLTTRPKLTAIGFFCCSCWSAVVGVLIKSWTRLSQGRQCHALLS